MYPICPPSKCANKPRSLLVWPRDVLISSEVSFYAFAQGISILFERVQFPCGPPLNTLKNAWKGQHVLERELYASKESSEI